MKHRNEESSLKNIKKALAASAICTVLCSMLLFSTSAAWFSSTKESKLNELYTGNLDVGLYYSKDMSEWKLVESTTNDIFNVDGHSMIWEPGATNIVYFKIENKGTLAAKYDFNIEIAEEVEGINFSGNNFKLSQYINGGVATDISSTYESNDEGRIAAIESIERDKTLQYMSEDLTPLVTGELNDSCNNKVFALVLYMPSSAADVTNYPTPASGDSCPKVSLKVKLVATQTVGEADGFGNMYDIGAYEIKVSAGENKEETTEAIKEAIQDAVAGSTILLPSTKDEEKIVLPSTVSKNVVIKGNGDTKVDATGSGNIASIPNGASFSGVDIEVGLSDYHGFQGAGPMKFVDCNFTGMYNVYSDTVFTNCTFTNTSGYVAKIYGGSKVEFINCKFYGSTKNVYLYQESLDSDRAVSFNDCVFNQSDLSGQKNKSAVMVNACALNSGSNSWNNHKYTLSFTRCNIEGGVYSCTGASIREADDKYEYYCGLYGLKAHDDFNKEIEITIPITVTVDGAVVYNSIV